MDSPLHVMAPPWYDAVDAPTSAAHDPTTTLVGAYPLSHASMHSLPIVPPAVQLPGSCGDMAGGTSHVAVTSHLSPL